MPPTKIRKPQERLDLGPSDTDFIDLAGRDGKIPGEGYIFELSADGIEWGDPEATRRIVATMLQDGDDERTDRWGNVSTKFTVRILADNFEALGRGERALAMQMGKRNSLRWTPPAERGESNVPVTEFVVMTSDMYPRTTAEDLLNYRSRWELEFRRLPWTRSTTLVTDAVSPSSGTVVTKADGSTLTSWTTNCPGSLVTYLAVSAIKLDAPTWPNDPYVEWAGNIGSTGYIWIDVAEGTVGHVSAIGQVGGRLPALAALPLTSGYTRVFFTNPNPGGGVRFWPAISGSIYIDGIGSSTTVPVGGMLAINPRGSVRTPAALSLALTGSGSDNQVMIYSDPTMLSHGWVPDNSSTWQNAPAGTYAVYANLNSSPTPTAKVYTVTVGSQVGRTRLPAAPAGGKFFPVDKLVLGNLRTGRLGSGVFPTVAAVGGAGTVDQVRIFRMADDTSLTFLNGGVASGTLTLDIPSIDLPRGGLWRNGASVLDKADTWGIPIIEPPTTLIWAWWSGSTTIAVTASHYAQWRLFAAE